MKKRHSIETYKDCAELARLLSVGAKIWFEGEKQGYTVQARPERYLVCVKT